MQARKPYGAVANGWAWGQGADARTRQGEREACDEHGLVRK